MMHRSSATTRSRSLNAGTMLTLVALVAITAPGALAGAAVLDRSVESQLQHQQHARAVAAVMAAARDLLSSSKPIVHAAAGHAPAVEMIALPARSQRPLCDADCLIAPRACIDLRHLDLPPPAC